MNRSASPRLWILIELPDRSVPGFCSPEHDIICVPSGEVSRTALLVEGALNVSADGPRPVFGCKESNAYTCYCLLPQFWYFQYAVKAKRNLIQIWLLGAALLQPLTNGAQPVTNTVTNTVTFIVDMSIQAALGNFSVANGDAVEIRGDFTGWTPGIIMTNNPGDANTNDFYTTIAFIGDEGSLVYFRYAITAPNQPEPQDEVVSPFPAGYRILTLVSPSGNYTNGPVYFSNQGPSDFVTVTDCLITFTVDMTPAIISGTFNAAVNQVFVNGLDNGIASWWTWGFLFAPPQYTMTEIGSGNLYTITLPVNQWQPLDLTYKYSIDGLDDEAGFGDNHSRYIRRFPNYTMPTDVFGSQGSTTSTEPSFGPNIMINYSNNQVWLSWLGRPGVSLQSATSLTPPIAWQPMPLTDGTNLLVGQGTGIAITNYTVGTSNLFWELIGPQ